MAPDGVDPVALREPVPALSVRHRHHLDMLQGVRLLASGFEGSPAGHDGVLVGVGRARALRGQADRGDLVGVRGEVDGALELDETEVVAGVAGPAFGVGYVAGVLFGPVNSEYGRL